MAIGPRGSSGELNIIGNQGVAGGICSGIRLSECGSQLMATSASADDPQTARMSTNLKHGHRDLSMAMGGAGWTNIRFVQALRFGGIYHQYDGTRRTCISGLVE
jgi:hypothetical protein